MTPRCIFSCFALVGSLAAPMASAQPTAPEVQLVASLCCRDTEQSFAQLPGRDLAEAALALALQRALEARIPFVTWKTDGEAATKLVLALVETPQIPLSLVELRWLRASGGAEELLAVDAIPLYAPDDTSREASNGERFTLDARAKLASALTSAFFEQLQREFVSRVSLASAVTPRPQERLVIVPLQFSRARLGMDSQLRVEFRSAAPSKAGRLELVNPARWRKPPQVDLIQASVGGAVVDSHALPLSEGWSDQLPQLLSGAQLSCYVTKFVPASPFELESDVVDDVVVQPQ